MIYAHSPPSNPTPVDGSGSARPGFIVLVAGTATEVSKTWAAAQVAQRLRHTGLMVAARKPAQSHESGDADTDAAVLAVATGEAARAVCREDRDYVVPMAPPMAASTVGLAPFTVADLGVNNAPRLCVAALDPVRPVVVLNRFDDGQQLHRRNLIRLRDSDGLDPVTSPQAFTDRLLRLLDERQ